MTWDGPRTPCSFWTPSIPPLEQRLPRRGLLVSTYRLLRATWMLITLPLHLTLLLASIVVGPTQTYERICSLACFHPLWNPRQRLVYPLLRRAIWAIADIGSADALTPNAKFKFPWWAWALEEFTVRVGRGARVRLRTSEVGMPAQAVESGWIQGDVVDMAGETEFEPVPCFWFEREDRRGLRSVYRKADEDERIVLYFVGGGYVTGSPTEGSRCFKLARESGLRVVGANFRKATARHLAFPAQLQDALAVYAHLVFDLGFRDIVLAGDSAGGNLALMLVQYLAGLEISRSDPVRATDEPFDGDSLVMPTGLLLFSPWCDLTAATYGEALVRRHGERDDPKHDIICPSMATNSIRLFLARVLSGPTSAGKLGGESCLGGKDDVATLQGAHPWFSPSLPSAESSWQRVARLYDTAPGVSPRKARRTSGVENDQTFSHNRRPLDVLATTGTTELFHLEIVRLCERLRRAAGGRGGGIEVECVSAEGEVHAFPLVPEWVSPEAAKAWGKIRDWLCD